MRRLGPIAAGQLLLAAHPGRGGYFERTVVLILDHSDSSTVGVVLNRPTERDLPWQISHWESLLAPPSVVFEGGPVAQGSAVMLGQLAHPRFSPPGFNIIFEDVGLIDLDAPEEVLRGAFSQVRLFSSLSGWAPGQLAGELISGGWIRSWASAEEVFSTAGDLWRRSLRRIGGTHGRWSTWTPQTTLN